MKICRQCWQIVACLVIVFTFSPAPLWGADADNAPARFQASQRLQLDEHLRLDRFLTAPPTPMDEALREAAQKNKHKATQPIQRDVQKALKSLALENGQPITPSSDVENTTQLSIADARALALKNNLTIQVAKIDPLIANTRRNEEEAKFDKIIFVHAKYGESALPKISSDSVVFKSDNPLLSEQQVKLSLTEQSKKSTELEAGVRIPLRTGGNLTLSSPFENKVSHGNFDSNEYRSALKFSFSQPLLRNAGRQVNEASIQIAQFDQEETALRTRLQIIRMIAMVDKAYWALYQAWAELDVRKQQYDYASQNLAMVKRRINEGLSAAIEMNRAEIGVADRLEALIIAETKLKLAQRQLKFLMNDFGRQSNVSQVLVPTTQPNLLKYAFDREKLLQEALGVRIELLTQELKLAADATNIQYLENQTLPLFSLDYQYGALSNTMNSLGNAYGNVLNGDFNDWAIGLKFEMPFTNEARKAALARAVEQRNQRLLTKTLQTMTIEKEINDTADQVEQDWQRILATRQQVLIAGLNYEAELKQFNEGLRTMTEVLEMLTRLGEAQIKEIRAITDYQTAMIDTAYATGTLLGYSKLDLQ